MTPPSLPKAFHFGVFELDLQAQELRKHGLRIRLQRKPLQILTLLLAQPGETVSREALRRNLWPDDEYGEFDQSLNTAIKKLRTALGDSAGTPRFIETQARLGYRFVAPVEAIADVERPANPIQDHQEGTPPRRARSGWWLIVVAVAVLCCVAVVAIRTWQRRSSYSGPAAERINSIAVLPLLNLSAEGGGGQDYLADGLTEALITNLSQIRELRVISRTSMMHYKGTSKMLPEIGRELKVDGIVEGSVSRRGPRVQVDVKLIHAATEKILWVEVYERDLEDILSLENEVAASIARRTAVKVTVRETEALSRSHKLDPKGYEAYLRGRFFWNMRSKDGLQKAIKYFEQAVESAPDYSLGYAGLADCYNVLSYYGFAKPEESFPKARMFAMKALRLDGTVAEAHAALGYALLHFNWDGQHARAEFDRALLLNPGYANAHHWQSHYLLAAGRTEDALAASKRALHLDPLNQSINAHMGHVLIYLERYDDAITQLQTTLEMNPQAARTHALLGRAYEGKRMFEQARAEFQEAIRISDGEERFKAGLAHVCAKQGRASEARTLLLQLEGKRPGGFVSPYALAEVHAALQEPDRAFEALTRAFDKREEQLIYLKVDPNLKTLRADARFDELVNRMRLPL